MQIVYSDPHILVVNKPADLSVLPEGWDKSAPYLVQKLEERYAKVWVVHRIDKVTSGIIVFALTAEAHRSLNIQFEKHEVEKTYHALVNEVPRWEEKVTKFPLRVNVGHKHRTVVDNRSGLRSETRFKILERYQASALVEACPMTGRTHQIRVHAYALGHPLLGDILYSAPETDVISRPALHAFSLTLTHPETGKRATFQADYPSDFQTAVGLLRGN
ncbi:MAG TPA: RluA family pseudouridine synthase [Anaerolineales bacterium]|jgi:RluA family pseudouridine synthase|nr:RluA family pseudouridine synthase [Anaerolineae bacterium]HRJ57350.1 RluA family pseudouridine synthase [Anaerolineales bacterium]HRK89029.1 RluA family pseudouridine synthase [Anaerolineales bacterium]